uniref:Uncharacterized protein n=1 Tax=Thermosporothrix sp. COM3 TaxID=2490863 RepID=A0A455SBI9_9CHLR|nr:hypothetical protein KTC_05780 [Thermosporothrix sp. COM3]
MAGNLHLPNLTCILVNNHSSTRDLGDMAAKLTSFGWTSTTINGRDHEQIYQALIQQDPTRPTAVIADIAR